MLLNATRLSSPIICPVIQRKTLCLKQMLVCISTSINAAEKASNFVLMFAFSMSVLLYGGLDIFIFDMDVRLQFPLSTSVNLSLCFCIFSNTNTSRKWKE